MILGPIKHHNTMWAVTVKYNTKLFLCHLVVSKRFIQDCRGPNNIFEAIKRALSEGQLQ